MAVGMSISDNPKPSEFQAIAEATKERPDAQQIHTMLLRSMQQAIYTPINSGHFGLAFEAYTHFTSPIRRYPDLLVHRVIKAILGNTRYQLPVLPTPGEAHAKLAKRLAGALLPQEPNRKRRQTLSRETQAWEAAGLHCSANERRADEASRDVEAWLKCKYMREHLGEEYSGVVSAATSFGIFVTLDAMYVEGLVHITELGGEYFKFDEARQELRGERTGIRYAIGTRVRVQVSRGPGWTQDRLPIGAGERGTARAGTQGQGRKCRLRREKVARTLVEKRLWQPRGASPSRKRLLMWNLRGVVARRALPSSRSRLRSSRRRPRANHPRARPASPGEVECSASLRAAERAGRASPCMGEIGWVPGLTRF